MKIENGLAKLWLEENAPKELSKEQAYLVYAAFIDGFEAARNLVYREPEEGITLPPDETI